MKSSRVTLDEKVNKLEEELEELKKWGSSLAYFYNDPSISQQKKATTLGIVKSGTAYLKNLNEEDALSEGLHRYQALVSDILYRLGMEYRSAS